MGHGGRGGNGAVAPVPVPVRLVPTHRTGTAPPVPNCVSDCYRWGMPLDDSGNAQDGQDALRAIWVAGTSEKAALRDLYLTVIGPARLPAQGRGGQLEILREDGADGTGSGQRMPPLGNVGVHRLQQIRLQPRANRHPLAGRCRAGALPLGSLGLSIHGNCASTVSGRGERITAFPQALTKANPVRRIDNG